MAPNTGKEKIVPDEKQQNMRLLYEENARMLRYFLTWRQLMFSGYFAILVALTLGFRWALISLYDYAVVFPFLGAVTGIAFYLLDARNKDFYVHVSKIGKNIEEQMGVEIEGYFKVYVDKKGEEVRHSWVINAFYLGGAIIMLIISLIGIIGEYPVLLSPG